MKQWLSLLSHCPPASQPSWLRRSMRRSVWSFSYVEPEVTGLISELVCCQRVNKKCTKTPTNCSFGILWKVLFWVVVCICLPFQWPRIPWKGFGLIPVIPLLLSYGSETIFCPAGGRTRSYGGRWSVREMLRLHMSAMLLCGVERCMALEAKPRSSETPPSKILRCTLSIHLVETVHSRYGASTLEKLRLPPTVESILYIYTSPSQSRATFFGWSAEPERRHDGPWAPWSFQCLFMSFPRLLRWFLV